MQIYKKNGILSQNISKCILIYKTRGQAVNNLWIAKLVSMVNSSSMSLLVWLVHILIIMKLVKFLSSQHTGTGHY